MSLPQASREPEDAVQRRAHLMAHRRQELALDVTLALREPERFCPFIGDAVGPEAQAQQFADAPLGVPCLDQHQRKVEQQAGAHIPLGPCPHDECQQADRQQQRRQEDGARAPT